VVDAPRARAVPAVAAPYAATVPVPPVGREASPASGTDGPTSPIGDGQARLAEGAPSAAGTRAVAAADGYEGTIATVVYSPRHRFRGKWALVTSGVLVAAAVATGAIATAGRLGPRAGAPPGGSTSAQWRPVLSVAGKPPSAAFAYLLAADNAARSHASAATAAACDMQAPGVAARGAALATLHEAVAVEDWVAATLAGDRARMLALRHGPALSTLLAQAARSSALADADLAMWVQDLDATGCYSAPTNNLHYQQAQLQLQVASSAQGQLESDWRLNQNH